MLATGVIVERFRGLPEGAQIGIFVVGILLAIVIPILVVAYHAQVFRGIVFLAIALSVVAVLGVVGYSLVKALRRWSRRKETFQKERAKAELSQQRERAELLKAIEEGRVPGLSDAGGLLLRSSESLWFRCHASLSDRKGQVYTGNLYVTSMRVVFSCVECPVEIPIGNINALDQRPGVLQIVGKTLTGTQVFGVHDGELAAAHIARSVRAYHRQVDVGFEKDASRHIPQDVKTAVWQRDGGKCVQCGATDYLEFDHIIPHAKGGASTVQNVQLLCRRCNLKKSDAI